MKRALGIDEIAIREYWPASALQGRPKSMMGPHLSSERWEMERHGSKGKPGCLLGHARGHTPRAESSRCGQRQASWSREGVPRALNRDAHGNIATHLWVWAARPRQSGFTLASSVLSTGMGPERRVEKTEEQVTGTQGGYTQGQGPSAHSHDNKAWLCVFYSFQYLPNPEGSQVIKYFEERKTDGTKLM